MWEKLKKKAAAAIPKVTKAVKAVADTAKKVGKAVKETRLGKLASKVAAAVPACVKSIGRTASKVRAAVPKYVDAAKQKAVAITAVNAAVVTVKKSEVKQQVTKAAGPVLLSMVLTETVAKESVNRALGQANRSMVEFVIDIPEKCQNVMNRVQEEFNLYQQDVIRGFTQKGVFYYHPHYTLDSVDCLLQMRKAVVEEFPIVAWKEAVLTSVHQTIRNGIIKGGDSFGNFVYNEDIPFLSNFVAGLFNASDRGEGDYSVASTIGGALNGVLAGGVLGLVDGVAGMISDPAEAIENISSILQNQGESVLAIWQGFKSYFNDNFVNGNPEDRARALGAIGFEAVMEIGSGGVAAAAKTGDKVSGVIKIAKGTKKVSRIVSAFDKTADVGRVANMVNRISDFGVLGKTGAKIGDVMAAFRSQLNPIGPRLASAMGVMDDAGDTGSISKLYNDLMKKVEVKQGDKGVKINKTTDAADAAEDIGDAGRGTGVEGGSGAVEGIGKLNKGIEIIDSKGKCLGEFDEIDLQNKIFYEDKTAKGLNVINPRTGLPSQTPQQFADKQIYTKTKNRINNLANSTGTREAKTNIVDNVPDISELQSIKKFVFRLDGDSPDLISAVQDSIKKLELDFPDYTFEATFGNH